MENNETPTSSFFAQLEAGRLRTVELLEQRDKRIAELTAELERQQAILERQLEQYRNARPRARFAYAAHITKTRGKLARLELELEQRS